jgi:Spy/CpxP family protein refolding chaperone
MKFNRFLPFILSGAMMLPIAALAQSSTTGTAADNSASAATSQAPDKERGEKFAEKLNLSSEQKADLKSIRDNMKQQAQAIKNDSSLTPDQKNAKFKELRKSSHEQMMAKLTPDQQAKFKEMRKEHRGHRHGRKGEAKKGAQS